MAPKGKLVLFFFSSLPSENSHIRVTIWLSDHRVKMKYEIKHCYQRRQQTQVSIRTVPRLPSCDSAALTVPHVGTLTLPKIWKDSKLHRKFSVSKSSTTDNTCYGHLPKLCFSSSFSSSTLSVKWSWYSSKSLLC